MLKITSDGRKLGLDPRLIDPSFEDNPDTKLNRCVENVARIHAETAEDRLTQIIFCDLGVPHKAAGEAEVEGEDADDVFSEETAMDKLGVGSKMVKSIKYWLLASHLVEEKREKNAKHSLVPTQYFGEIVKKHDPYFEDIFTLWIIHYYITADIEFNTVYPVFLTLCDICTSSFLWCYKNTVIFNFTRNSRTNTQMRYIFRSYIAVLVLDVSFFTPV